MKKLPEHKREKLLKILQKYPELSLREIARLVGVSHETVRKYRKIIDSGTFSSAVFSRISQNELDSK